MYGGIATTSGGGTLSLANMMNSRVLDRFSIFVGNLPETITERELRDQFRLYGAIDHLQLIRKSTSSSRTSPKKVFAFIRYGNEIDTARAIDQEVWLLVERKLMERHFFNSTFLLEWCFMGWKGNSCMLS